MQTCSTLSEAGVLPRGPSKVAHFPRVNTQALPELQSELAARDQTARVACEALESVPLSARSNNSF